MFDFTLPIITRETTKGNTIGIILSILIFDGHLRDFLVGGGSCSTKKIRYGASIFFRWIHSSTKRRFAQRIIGKKSHHFGGFL
jgi:hypothetical protein